MGHLKKYISVEGDYCFQIGVPNQREQIINLIAREFSKNEPLSCSLRITQSEMRKQFAPVVEASLALELCIVVTEIASGSVVAVCLFQDFRFPYFTENKNSKGPAEPIFALMKETYGKIKPDPNSSIELHVCAVDQNYSSTGLATRLTLFSRKIVQSRGYKTVYCVLTLSLIHI